MEPGEDKTKILDERWSRIAMDTSDEEKGLKTTVLTRASQSPSASVRHTVELTMKSHSSLSSSWAMYWGFAAQDPSHR